MKKLSSALAMIVLMTSPALAAEQSGPFTARETVSIKVSTDGLDLNSPRDRARLRNRMDKAIDAICSPQDVYASYQGRDYQCYREMAANAENQMRAYALNDTDGVVAKN